MLVKGQWLDKLMVESNYEVVDLNLKKTKIVETRQGEDETQEPFS